jgi:hypothetical protein
MLITFSINLVKHKKIDTAKKKQDMQFVLLLQIAPIYVHTVKYSKH